MTGASCPIRAASWSMLGAMNEWPTHRARAAHHRRKVRWLQRQRRLARRGSIPEQPRKAKPEPKPIPDWLWAEVHRGIAPGRR